MRCALFAALLLVAAPAHAQSWIAESEHTLPSADTGWGDMTLEPGSGRLFIARKNDGLLVWDPKTNKAQTVENSRGAAAVVLARGAGRGYAAMLDGTALSFDLQTLQPISREDLGAGSLEDGFYEPTENRVYMLTGPRPEKTTWVGLEAATGKVVSRTEFNSKWMGTPVADGQGGIYAPQRDRSLLQKLHANDLSLQKTWKLGDCGLPMDVLWEASVSRILVACRGEKPMFLALDPGAGIVASVPIGRGVGDMALDSKRGLIVTANGLDGTMSVIRQGGPSDFTLAETISTRPMARDLAIDPATQQLYTVTASFTEFPAKPEGQPKPTYFHPNSFTVLAYRPQ